MSTKYTIIKGKTGKSKKVNVEGVKKVLYKKDGNRKKYVVSKGKMMQLTKYKEMKKKQKKSVKKSVKSKLNKKKRRGGVGPPQHAPANWEELDTWTTYMRANGEYFNVRSKDDLSGHIQIIMATGQPVMVDKAKYSHWARTRFDQRP